MAQVVILKEKNQPNTSTRFADAYFKCIKQRYLIIISTWDHIFLREWRLFVPKSGYKNICMKTANRLETLHILSESVWQWDNQIRAYKKYHIEHVFHVPKTECFAYDQFDFIVDCLDSCVA